MADPAPTVFIVDDDASVRKSIARLLNVHGFDVESLDSAEAYLDRAPHGGSGCVLLDVCMPGLDGLALQAKLKASGHTLPIIFVTGHGDIPMSVQAIKHGAVDFLIKPVDEAQLLAAVRVALARQAEFRDEHQSIEFIRARVASLTPREHDVMYCLLTGAPNKTIGLKLGIAEKTVKVHRARVMEKMGAASIVELVRMCLRAGIDSTETPTMSNAAAGAVESHPK